MLRSVNSTDAAPTHTQLMDFSFQWINTGWFRPALVKRALGEGRVQTNTTSAQEWRRSTAVWWSCVKETQVETCPHGVWAQQTRQIYSYRWNVPSADQNTWRSADQVHFTAVKRRQASERQPLMRIKIHRVNEKINSRRCLILKAQYTPLRRINNRSFHCDTHTHGEPVWVLNSVLFQGMKGNVNANSWVHLWLIVFVTDFYRK